MKVQQIDMSQESQLVTNLIIYDNFLRDMQSLIKPRLFKSTYARHVAQWCSDYYDRYKQAPKLAIEDLFIEHRPKLQEEDAESIGEFLANLSKKASTDATEHNHEYQVKRATDYLNLRSLELLNEELEKAVRIGNIEAAQAAVANFSKIEVIRNESMSILDDSSKIFQAFNNEEETLFTFPGAIGGLAGPQMRGDLSMWVGAAKKGKSFALWTTAEAIMSAGGNVVFFSLEMRSHQIYRRAWQSLTGKPRTTRSVKTPYFVVADGYSDDDSDVKYEIAYREGIKEGWEDANMDIKSMQKQLKLAMRGGGCRIICLPTNTASVQDIENHIDNLEFYEGFTADAIVIDYADLLVAHRKSSLEERHRLNSIYLDLRSMAQRRNLYICTASQTNRGAQTKDAGVENIGEDLRKIMHVSSAWALNQSASEREQLIMRVKPLVQRDEAVSHEQAIVLQNLACGRFYIDSKPKSQVYYKSGGKKDEEEDEE